MRRLADIDMAVALGAVPLERLGEGRLGVRGVVAGLKVGDGGGLSAEEMERRLLEMGFVEGARVEILHEGLFGRDPIAVRVDDMRIALRRKDARGIFIRADPEPAERS